MPLLHPGDTPRHRPEPVRRGSNRRQSAASVLDDALIVRTDAADSWSAP